MPFYTTALQTLLGLTILLFVCLLDHLFASTNRNSSTTGSDWPLMSRDKKTDHSFGFAPNHQNGRGSRSFSTRPPCGQARRWQQKLRSVQLFARRSPCHTGGLSPSNRHQQEHSELTDSTTHSWSFHVNDARPHRRTMVQCFDAAPDLVWVTESD